MVWTAAAALASLRVEPIFARSVAAAVISSGAALTYDMSIHPLARRADLDEIGAQPGVEESRALLAWLAFGRGSAGGHSVSRCCTNQTHTNRRGGRQ